jgi:DNA-binding response OmpR family regulator
VEDYEPTRAVMASALREYSPAFAADGREALARLNAETFDAFVLDLWLPDYTGIPLCREIRDIDPHVPIIFWTVAEGDDLRARALRAGATTYLRKTEDYEPLRNKLRELLVAADERCSLARSAANATLTDIRARYSATDTFRTQTADAARTSLERLAKPRTREAFLEAGGTLSRFERWWSTAV